MKVISKKILFWINCILKFMDVSLTTYIIRTHGSEAEINPIMRSSIEEYGLMLTMIFSFIVHTALMYTLYREDKKWVLVVVAFLMIIVVMINLFSIARCI